jgi:nitrogen regulatory protein PII
MILETSQSLVCLHVAFPRSLEEEVLDVCRAIADMPGFTVIAADGFGQGAHLHTVRETVLGRAQRRLLMIVANRTICDRVVSALRHALPTPEAAYWVVAVSEFGRLA